MRWTMLNSNYKNSFNHLVFPHVTGLHLPGCHSAKQISGIRHLIVFSAATYLKTSFRSTSDGRSVKQPYWIYFCIHPDWKYDNADHMSVLSELACVVQLWFVIAQHSYSTERLSMKCLIELFTMTPDLVHYFPLCYKTKPQDTKTKVPKYINTLKAVIKFNGNCKYLS